MADFRFFLFSLQDPKIETRPLVSKIEDRPRGSKVENRPLGSKIGNRPLVSKWASSDRKSATRVQNWKPVPVSKIENRPLGLKFIFRFWIQVANLQFSILYTSDWWQVYKKYVFHSSPSQQLVFRGEDHLHSRGASSGSASVDGNESSPYPIYENGKFLFNNLNSSPSLKFLLSLLSTR